MKIRTFVGRRIYWLSVIALCCLGFPACEESFRPELEEFDPILVIEGGINNRPGPYTVRLSFSSGIYPEDQQAVEDAMVEIIEEGGDREMLSENEPGLYTTTNGGIRGIPGKSYKVRIRLENGNQYESEYQKMPAPIGIESVDADLESQFVSIDEPDILGYQFYVTSEQAANTENYLLWSLEATFKYRADYTIDYVYENYRVEPYPNPTEFMTCWRTDQVNEVFTFNTSALSEPKIERLPLHFLRGDGREMSIRYSLLVKQLTLTQEAYTFWDNLKRLIESQESLYNIQPFQIRGNVRNVDDPEERVLGFFLVSGQTEKRIFVDRPEEVETPFSYCSLNYMLAGFLGLVPEERWPIYIYEDDTGAMGVANDACFDCRELGGTLIEPEFWEE